jgi:hypothetical protein
LIKVFASLTASTPTIFADLRLQVHARGQLRLAVVRAGDDSAELLAGAECGRLEHRRKCR